MATQTASTYLQNIPASILDDLAMVSGFDKEAFLAAHLQNAITSIRLHPIKNYGLYPTQQQVPWCQAGRYVTDRPVFTLDPAYHSGAYYVQEASSMFLHHVLATVIKDKKGIKVLDLCAAPGGKSTLIASLLDNESLLIANEVIRQRATILDENTTRWGYMNTFVTCNDPRDFTQLPSFFDVIVVDAPCSGSGLFRKDKNALAHWSQDNVQLCSQRQQRILADVLPALKQGGILIYATCSFSIAENEQVLDWLATQYAMQSVPIPIDKDWGVIEINAPINNITAYRFLPNNVMGEGFFISALQKTTTEEDMKPQRFKTTNDKKIQQQAAYLLTNKELVFIKTDPENYSAMHPSHEADYLQLHKHLYFRKAGLRLGMPAQKEWLPAHDVALSIDAAIDLPYIEVTKDDALHFLKKENLPIEGNKKGWHIIKHNGLGLGWAKLLGNRMNNYLPKHWRIRMDIESSLSEE